MGPCMKRLLLLAAFERISQTIESDFLQRILDMIVHYWSTSRFEPMLSCSWALFGASPLGGGNG